MSKKILVIDDDKLARTGLRSELEQAGYKIDEAVDGKDGYEKALDLKPDLIVTDVHMPKMDGLEMIAKLREDKGWGSKVPIVVLTVEEATTAINQALSAGVTHYLSKTGMSPDTIAEQVITAVG